MIALGRKDCMVYMYIHLGYVLRGVLIAALAKIVQLMTDAAAAL